jgi:glucose/mannose-6-phosphate isomerase
MKAYIQNFTTQLKEALTISESIQFGFSKNDVQNIVIAGLGGSGIGGTIVKDLVFNDCTCPIYSCKDYNLPAFVNKNTLVICNSYSGNTEETLQAFEQALAKNAMVFCITSGGKLLEKAKALNLPFVIVPGGNPPRACLSYSLVQLLILFKKLDLYKADVISEIQNSIQYLDANAQIIKEEAYKLSEKLVGKIAALYALDGNEGIVTRFKQQIQENAKVLCWHNMIPEMNHNELVGWANDYSNIAVIVLRSQFDYVRNISRLDIIKPILETKAASVDVVFGKGKTKLEELLYLTHLTDWVSYGLADLRKVDSIEVNVIDFLKSELGGKA